MKTEILKSSDTNFSELDKWKLNWPKDYSFSSPVSPLRRHHPQASPANAQRKKCPMIKWVQKIFIDKPKFLKGENSTLAWSIIIFCKDAIEVFYKMSLNWCHYFVMTDLRFWWILPLNLIVKIVYRVNKKNYKTASDMFHYWREQNILKKPIHLTY